MNLNQHEWILRRNCSVTPRQMVLAYACLCAGSMGVAAMFVLQGIWVVSIFSILELSVVTYFFVRYARHATDYERITLHSDDLLILTVQAGVVYETHLNPNWTNIEVESKPRTTIYLKSAGKKIRIAQFVNESMRRQFVHELRNQLPFANT